MKRTIRGKLIGKCMDAVLVLLGMVILGGVYEIIFAEEISVDVEAGKVYIVEEVLAKPTEAPAAERIEEITKLPEETPILVNKENALPRDYEVSLITLPDGYSKAAEEAYEPLCELLKACREEGLEVLVCSSYRSRERQEELFDEDVEELLREGYTYKEAYKEVSKETMPPGCSEHSTGLAFDIVAEDYQMLDKGQEKTAENKWLRKHCAEYGFILRYPKGKEEITDISYESWHFRYVGKEIAEYIMEKGITLEEYLEEVC